MSCADLSMWWRLKGREVVYREDVDARELIRPRTAKVSVALTMPEEIIGASI